MKCLICHRDFKVVSHLHLRTHQMSISEYSKKFGVTQFYSDEVRSKISKSHAGKVVIRTKPMSAEGRANISAARLGKKYGPSSEAKKEKQRKSWADNYEARCASIKVSSNKPERVEAARQKQKDIIAKNGYHLSRGRETCLEVALRKYFETANYIVVKQKASTCKINGVYRYFDMFIPALNILLEVDGEYWHSKPDRILIDLAKQQYAFDNNYHFIRLSDKDLGRSAKIEDIELLVSKSREEHKLDAIGIIARRQARLQSLG